MINTSNWTIRHLRRAASRKLVEMTSGTHWVQSADALGMLQGSASRTQAVLRDQIPEDGMWQEFGTALVWSEVTQAEHLQCPPLKALCQSDGPEARRVGDRVAQLLTPSCRWRLRED